MRQGPVICVCGCDPWKSSTAEEPEEPAGIAPAPPEVPNAGAGPMLDPVQLLAAGRRWVGAVQHPLNDGEGAVVPQLFDGGCVVEAAPVV